jgi:hypothetical protein
MNGARKAGLSIIAVGLIIFFAGPVIFGQTLSITAVSCPIMTVVINGNSYTANPVPASTALAYYNVQNVVGAFFLWQVSGNWVTGTGVQSVTLPGYTVTSWGTTQLNVPGQIEPLYVQVSIPWFVYAANTGTVCGINAPPTSTSTVATTTSTSTTSTTSTSTTSSTSSSSTTTTASSTASTSSTMTITTTLGTTTSQSGGGGFFNVLAPIQFIGLGLVAVGGVVYVRGGKRG